MIIKTKDKQIYCHLTSSILCSSKIPNLPPWYIFPPNLETFQPDCWSSQVLKHLFTAWHTPVFSNTNIVWTVLICTVVNFFFIPSLKHCGISEIYDYGSLQENFLLQCWLYGSGKVCANVRYISAPAGNWHTQSLAAGRWDSEHGTKSSVTLTCSKGKRL